MDKVTFLTRRRTQCPVAETLEASVTLGLALEKAGVREESLLEAAALAQLVFVQVSQSSVAVKK